MVVLQAQVTHSQADRAWEIYYRFRRQIETPNTIGKLVVLDLNSGDYLIADDDIGLAASALLRERHSAADLFALRVGYDVSASLSGAMERLPE